MRLRRTMVVSAGVALLAALVPSTATATTGPYCYDPGFSEVAPIYARGSANKLFYVGSLCRGAGQALNVRLNTTDAPSNGSYTLSYYEEANPGQPRVTSTASGTFTASSALTYSQTLYPRTGGFVRAYLTVDGQYQGSRTVTETTPTAVTTPKTAAQKKTAKKARDKSLKKAKKAYKKSGHSKKGKTKYTKAVRAAKARYAKAIKPSVTVVNKTTTRQVAEVLPWSSTARYNY